MATGAMIAGGVVAATQTATGIAQSVQAKKAIDDFEFDPLYNPYTGQTISTAGGLLQLEQANRNLATSANTISSAGSRGLSYLNQATGQAANTARTVGADWDAQQKNLNMAEAGADMQIQQIENSRDMAEMAGYSSLFNAGQANIAGGLSGIGSSMMLGSMTGAFDGMGATPKKTGANTFSQFTNPAANQINPNAFQNYSPYSTNTQGVGLMSAPSAYQVNDAKNMLMNSPFANPNFRY